MLCKCKCFVNANALSKMGLKKNILYNSFLTGANFIFPFITYPYLSRVLGVEYMGVCNFAHGVVSFFLLFSTLGSVVLGIRETARCRDDKAELSKVFNSIFVLNLICTLVVLAGYILSIFVFPNLSQYKNLLFIGTLQIFFTPFLIEWFYQGLEDFKYITIRSLAVRLIYVVSIFFFVKEKSDYDIYFLLTILSMVANAVFNWTYKNKFVRLHYSDVELARYVKPFFTFGLYKALSFMYISFNTVFLGMVNSPVEVGYYTTATKLLSICMALFTAASSAIMPRVSNMLKNDAIESVKKINYMSFELVFPLALNLIVFCEIFAPEIVLLISGAGYENAILPLRIISPLILVIGVSNVVVVQILTPMKQDRAILINSIIGAIVALSLNMLIVKNNGSVGSACVWLISESAVLISALYFTIRKIGQVIPLRLFLGNLVSVVPTFIALYGLKFIDMNYIVRLICALALLLIMAFVFQKFVLKNSIVSSLLSFRRKTSN